MLIGIVGELGTGKTTVLTWLGYRAYLKGRTVYANYGVKFPHIKVINPGDIIKMQNGVFLGDELWVWLDSRMAQRRKNIMLAEILRLSRKKHLDIIYTTQYWKQMDIRIRVITDIVMIPEIKSSKKCIVHVLNCSGDLISKMRFNPSVVWKLFDSYSDIYYDKETNLEEIAKQIKIDDKYKLLKSKKAKVAYIKRRFGLTNDEAYLVIDLVSI